MKHETIIHNGIEIRKIPEEPDYGCDIEGNIYSFKFGQINRMVDKAYPNRYRGLKLSNNNTTKTICSHRLVALTWVENPENKNVVDHIDKNIHNNHASNLRWVTTQENIHHSYSTLSPVRNYRNCELRNIKTNEVRSFKSRNEACRYYATLGGSYSSLSKHSKHGDYELINVKV